MAVKLTAAEAKALGIAATFKAKKPKTTGKTVRAKDCLPNRCCTCGYTTKGETDEARHNKETGHGRYEAILSDADLRDGAGGTGADGSDGGSR